MKRHRPITLLVLVLACLLFVSLVPVQVPAAPEPISASRPEVVTLDDAPFGLNTHLATRHPNLETMHEPAERVAQTGIGWAREDIHWWRIQPTSDTWDWSFTDRAIQELLLRDIEIVGVLGHPPGWATTYTNDDPSEHSFYAPDQALFVEYATAVVARYGRHIKHWEIWNEPDNPLFWKPKPDSHAYTQLLQQTATAIRDVDPEAIILLGGINPFDTDFLEDIARADAWDSFDILAIHPYVDPSEPEIGNIVASTDGVRALAERYGEKPIWVTEIGWSSGPGDRDTVGLADEQDQANYLVRSYLLLWYAGVERIFWYTLKDDAHNPYGLITYGDGREDYSELKPAFHALQTLNEQLSGTEFVDKRDLFTRTTIIDFETPIKWQLGNAANGRLRHTQVLQQEGQVGGKLTYDFASTNNDYVVFLPKEPISIPDDSYAVGLWIYGDGSGNTFRIRLVDAEGEILQYRLGTIGSAGWRLIQTPIGESVSAWNQISKDGNGRLDFPAQFQSLILDDSSDRFVGKGTVYVDNLTAISGPEAYNIQLQSGDEAVDILWAPDSVRARLASTSNTASLTRIDGIQQSIAARNKQLFIDLGPDPVYIRHTR
ncbi:MAG: glycosyl hydrolase [Chloroflexota bacterium]